MTKAICRSGRNIVSRFLGFHDIQPEAVRPFEAILHFLKEHTNVVSLSDYLEGDLSEKRINVVITFDDGYKSWCTTAVPMLRRFELPATFFVCSGFVGLSKQEQVDFAQSKLFVTSGARVMTGALCVDDLKRLADYGFTIGGHTVNHCRLDKVRDSDDLTQEIVLDKRKLEGLTGTELQFFSYPSGAFENKVADVQEVLRLAGYKAAVTTIPGFNRISTDPYYLHRDMVGDSTPRAVIRARLCGSYDAVSQIKRWLSQERRLLDQN